MCVKLAVGDLVVYANHETGSVSARETQTVLGGTREVVVVELDEGLTVTLPLELAQQLLRPLASEADLQMVQETLRGESVLSVALFQDIAAIPLLWVLPLGLYLLSFILVFSRLPAAVHRLMVVLLPFSVKATPLGMLSPLATTWTASACWSPSPSTTA